MDTKLSIQNIKLSFSCHENYQQMKPCESGRHCSSFKKEGYDCYMDFIKLNMRVLDDTTTGKVFVSFAVEKTGEMTDIKVVKGLSKATENEALRLVSLMEFSPATVNERKVRLIMKIPVRFGKTK